MKYMPIPLLLVLCVLACGDTKAPVESPFQLTAQGVESRSHIGLSLHPVAHINGARVETGDCTVKGLLAHCPVSVFGVLRLELVGEVVHLRFEALQDCTLNGMGFEGVTTLDGATSWLSNGYQSLSQSGMIALGAQPPSEELQEDLLATGDPEALRNGQYHSWWYTLVGGGTESLVLGATEARVLKSWISLYAGDAGVEITAMSGAVGEAIPMKASSVVDCDPWFIGLGPDPHALLERYATHIPARRNPTVTPQIGWNSWYELGDTVTEDDIRANATSVRALYEAYEVSQNLRIVVDDGWQVAWGEWTPNEKFPSGMDGLAADLRADGFTMGVWLAPLLVSEESEVFKEHPEWLVKDATWGHPFHGSLRVLDITHPEAAQHLQETIKEIVSWGYDFLKIDFLAAGSLEGGHYENVTGMQHLDRALALIREAAGEEVTLLAVIAPPIAPFPYVDGWRVGNDIAYPNIGPRWPFIPNQLRSVGARWPFCLRTFCDADPPLLRELPSNEVEAGAWVVALAGGAMFLSDDVANLDPERWSWGLSSEVIHRATTGEPARPIDLFPGSPPAQLSTVFEDIAFKKTSHIAPALWRFPDGMVIGFNIADESREIEGVTLPPHSATALTP